MSFSFGKFKDIIDVDGIIKFGESHSHLAGEGNPVLGAGTFLIKDGEIVFISNLSGILLY